MVGADVAVMTEAVAVGVRPCDMGSGGGRCMSACARGSMVGRRARATLPVVLGCGKAVEELGSGVAVGVDVVVAVPGVGITPGM